MTDLVVIRGFLKESCSGMRGEREKRIKGEETKRRERERRKKNV